MINIDFFSSNTWPHCHTAREYLQQNGYKFTEHNIQSDPTARQTLLAHKMRGVPAFIVNGEAFVGLDLEKLNGLIDYTVEGCPNCQTRLRLPKNKGVIRATCPNCEHQFEVDTK